VGAVLGGKRVAASRHDVGRMQKAEG
jgi:hypothetical protein